VGRHTTKRDWSSTALDRDDGSVIDARSVDVDRRTREQASIHHTAAARPAAARRRRDRGGPCDTDLSHRRLRVRRVRRRRRAFRSGEGYAYTRIGNPTIDAVEHTLAALEGGSQALLLASGQAATTVALLSLLEAGQHIVASTHIYEERAACCAKTCRVWA
jgi:cystathionine beta-lyase/cystathionine gamma-synthase